MTNSVSSLNTVAAFFSGVGGIELGFKQTGKFRVVYANEFDKNAQLTYEANHTEEDIFFDTRDIHEVKTSEVPKSDVIVGGFPCQAFSIAGYRKGFDDDRGDLFFELLRIIKNNKPRAIFIENVKNMVTHDHGNTFKIIREALTMNGYYIKWKVMNGKEYGNVPQNRERIYIVGFRSKEAFLNFTFPSPIPLKKNLTDVINFSEKVAERYYYKKGKQPFYDKLEEAVTKQETVYQWRRQYVRENKSGVVPTLTANMGTGGHNVPIIKSDHGIRKLTPRETFNVQGFPSNFKLLENIAHGQLYKQAGNSVVVPVIKRIAKEIAHALEHDKLENEISENRGFHIMYTDMLGRFEGQSYLVEVVETKQQLLEFEEKNKIKFLDSRNYLKNVQKNKEMIFYSYE